MKTNISRALVHLIDAYLRARNGCERTREMVARAIAKMKALLTIESAAA